MVANYNYIPALRWKQSERLALRALDDSDKDRMTPLVELPLGYFDEVEDADIPTTVVAIAEDLADSWGARPMFLDLAEVPITSNAEAALLTIFARAARQKGLTVIPVSGISRPARFHNAIVASLEAAGGLCLRLTRGDLAAETFARRLDLFLSSSGLTPERVDLVVDYGVWDNGVPSFGYLAARIPAITRWRSFTLLAGSFPADLQVFTQLGQYESSRDEWLSWRDQVLNRPSALPRFPQFGDYTIQFGRPTKPPKRANVSASIRYTADDYWVVMRGAGLFHKTSPGNKQYFANAELLSLRKEFCGGSFSYGDRYIAQVATREIDTPGTPMTWLRAGINHHLVFVLRQLSHMPSA